MVDGDLDQQGLEDAAALGVALAILDAAGGGLENDLVGVKHCGPPERVYASLMMRLKLHACHTDHSLKIQIKNRPN